MRTINFCGDSFCENTTHESSWTTRLAQVLDARIVGSGKGGTAHEYAIQCFDPSSDITIFCWTEAHRIYHPDVPLNLASSLESSSSVHMSARAYYKYLHQEEYSTARQMRDLYWFDHTQLSTYRGLSVHLWCFKETYQFTHGIQSDIILKNQQTQQANTINHFTERENRALATYVEGLING